LIAPKLHRLKQEQVKLYPEDGAKSRKMLEKRQNTHHGGTETRRKSCFVSDPIKEKPVNGSQENHTGLNYKFRPAHCGSKVLLFTQEERHCFSPCLRVSVV